MGWTRLAPLFLVVALSSAACTKPGGCELGTTRSCTCGDGRDGVSECRHAYAWNACECDLVCGNHVCEFENGETPTNCPTDCTPVCGNAVCDATETSVSCPEDCSALLTRKLDVLFVVGNTAAMGPKQASLGEHFADFVAALSSAVDLHVGVVTSDLGAGQFMPATCDTIGGDQGMLQNSPLGPTCASAQLASPADRFLAYAVDSSGGVTANFSGSLADAFACYAAVGTGGCRFAHPLASLHAALDGCAELTGCKQRQNVGFLREDAYLAIIVLSEEDDCSAPPNSTLFDPTQTTLDSALGPLSTYRCFEFGELCGGLAPGRGAGERDACAPGNHDQNPSHQLIATADFADFLWTLRPQGPRMLHLAVITGPTSPVVVDVDASGFPRLESVCADAMGSAYPGLRLADLVGRLPDQARLVSICADDLGPAMTQIGSEVAQMMAQ